MHITLHGSRAQDEPPNVSVARTHSIFMPSMMCVWALLVLVLSFSCFSPSFTSSLPHSTCTLPGTPSSMLTPPRVKTTAPSHNEEYCPMAIYHPITVFGAMETCWWDPLFNAAPKRNVSASCAAHFSPSSIFFLRHPYSFPFATVVTRSFTTMLSRGTQ